MPNSKTERFVPIIVIVFIIQVAGEADQ